MKIKSVLCVSLLLLPLADSLARTEEELKRLQELDQRCKEAREALLRPLRQAKVEECVAEKIKTREECAFYWSDYGWGASPAPGLRSERFYDQIPECVASFNAWQQSKP